MLRMESNRRQHLCIANVLRKLHPALEATAMTIMATMDRVSPLSTNQSPAWHHHTSPRNHPAEELATRTQSGAPRRRQDSQRLQRTRKAVAEVEPQGHHGHNILLGIRPMATAGCGVSPGPSPPAGKGLCAPFLAMAPPGVGIRST